MDRLRERAMSSHTNAEMFTTHSPRALPFLEKIPNRSSAPWLASDKSLFLYSQVYFWPGSKLSHSVPQDLISQLK